MQLINTLELGGAESLGLTISRHLNKDGTHKASICGLFKGRGPLADIAEKNEVTTRYFKNENKSRFKIMQELYHLLRHEQVSVLQVHGAYLLQYAVLPALLSGAKIIYTEHAKYSLSKSPTLKRKSRYLSLFTKKVVCVSYDMKSFMTNQVGVSPSRVEVIHNGVDLSDFSIRYQEDPPNKRKDVLIGTVARLSEPKDHGNLLRAFALVREKIPGVRLLLIGDGELRSDIELMIHQHGQEKNVDMLGRRSDIPELLAGMDIFVLPSKREGFPISILEAMACGKPVVATDVGGVKEIISSGNDGLIVPPEDHYSLAAAIIRIIEDIGLRKRLESGAVNKIVSNFSKEVMMQKYMNLFNSVGG